MWLQVANISLLHTHTHTHDSTYAFTNYAHDERLAQASSVIKKPTKMPQSDTSRSPEFLISLRWVDQGVTVLHLVYTGVDI